ncbi:MAG: acyl-CoA thioesterase domain-containing protein, partial [Nocardioides sp.]
MPASADELVELLDLENLDVDLFRGRQPDTERQRVFGGQVAAQALIAGIRTADDDLRVHSLHSYFLRPGDTAVPIIYDVERLRDGRSFSTRQIVARQHGRPIYFMTASFQRDEEGLEHQDVIPSVAGPEHGIDFADLAKERGASSESFAREWAAL